MGKFVLPWFGGGPSVWTTCLLFFQVLLVGGYAYAHWLTRRLKPKTQVWVHLGVLAIAVATLPVTPGAVWKPVGNSQPLLGILELLAVCVGLPYFVLSTTGPLLQNWFHARFPARSPYRLYALSNAGSLLALVSFPFLFEPQLNRQAQAKLWGAGLMLYAATCAVCAWNKRATAVEVGGQGSGTTTETAEEPAQAPTLIQKLMWLLLPATASVLLLATTNKLCQDIAAIPFLWVGPLCLYLLSFILCFESEGWYRRVPYTMCLWAVLGGLCWGLYSGGDWPLWRQLLVYGTGLFISCMVCHGELYRLRPAPASLTQYYLWIAAGGALGGVFVALVAPLLFTQYFELHWGMMFCAGLLFFICALEGTFILPVGPLQKGWAWLASVLPLLAFAGLDLSLSRTSENAKFLAKAQVNALRVMVWIFMLLLVCWVFWRLRQSRFARWRLLACCWLGLGVAGLAGALWTQARSINPDRVYRSRNFYGVLTVFDHRRNEPQNRYLLLQHGRITHGLQFVDAAQATWPTTYYGAESGVGLALSALTATNRHIGLVGLGAGTLVCYGRPGDQFTIYEINPEVIHLAQTRFTYLQNCASRIRIVPGDARLSLEREDGPELDLLALDAFSGDAIPVHLLTREAFELYGRHLKAGGVLAVHVSNHFLDLVPVVLNLAKDFGYYSAVIDYDETPDQWWLYSSTWILLTKDPFLLEMPEISTASTPATVPQKGPLWTDDFSSLYRILK